MDDTLILTGQLLEFTADPFAVEDPGAAARHLAQGAVAVAGGRILATGPAEAVLAAHPCAQRQDLGPALILPGFVDAHVHYPQTGIIASWGRRLIDWLEGYTFPEETRFADPAYAAQVAARYLDLVLAHGTTTVASFCTSHPASVEAFFAAAEARGMRVVAGKTAMDRNAPAALCDTPARAHDESAALLARWHGRGRAVYAVSPRFAPTSSPEQLEAMGALWAAHPDCPMQTHLAEQPEEIAWVAELFPQARDYTDVYDMFGLLGPGGLYGHAIHLSGRERARLREAGGGLIHCPTSNSFIGSGLMPLAALAAEGQVLGLASDTGGGSNFSMLRTMGAAYEIGQLAGTPLHPAQLLWLATAGAAKALRLERRIGTLEVGSEADLVALDLASTPAIAQRAARAEDIWEALFPTLMMGDDRAVAGVWVAGTAAKPAV